jgi:glutamyl-Q tRNA(Asp) synthetase
MTDSATPGAATAAAPVRGRFAPSPTGGLHFGSLIAAVASHCDARARGGAWLLRIEDLDPPREVAGAAAEILRALAACALDWDGDVQYQSRRGRLYQAALQRLIATGAAYPCACTRREVALGAPMGIEGPAYPGTCRSGIPAGRRPRVWRLRVPEGSVTYRDECYGPRTQDVARQVGDFVLRRADGLFAYQLAVVVDDAEQAITRVVRGSDLLESTPRQIVLQHLLGLPTPAYLHVPTAVGADGQKLSKQNLARPLDLRSPGAAWLAALRFLGQEPPAELADAPAGVIRQWACQAWDPAKIPRLHAMPAPAEQR